MLNKIYTIKEYMEHGYTEAEAYAVRLHDKLVNKWIIKGYSTEAEDEKIIAIAKKFGW